MFKLMLLSALLVAAAARPSHLHLSDGPLVYSTVIHEPVLAKVGTVVNHIPTAVSHQSQSVVHSTDHVIEDLHAPLVKLTSAYHVAPALKTYAVASPVLHSDYEYSKW